jgi:hypothetical protein
VTSASSRAVRCSCFCNHAAQSSVMSYVIGTTRHASRMTKCVGIWLGALAPVIMLFGCGTRGTLGAKPTGAAGLSAITGEVRSLKAPVPATPAQRRQIVAALNSEGGLDGFLGGLQGFGRIPARARRHVDYTKLELDVTSIRVSLSKPLLASAVVEPLDRRGRRVLPAAIVVLSRNSAAESRLLGRWSWALGPATSFPGSCARGVELSVRELLCPNPWVVLGYRPSPGIRSGLGFSTPAGATNLRSVAWADVSVPGSVCGAGKPIRLHDGTAFAESAVEPWWPVVMVSGGIDGYGELAGRDAAVVGIGCDNGGGTADGELGFAAVVYTLKAGRLSVRGVLTPQQPFSLSTPHVPILGRVTIRNNEVIADEYWYRPNDGTADPSERAVTFWKLSRGVLRPFRTVIDKSGG